MFIVRSVFDKLRTIGLKTTKILVFIFIVIWTVLQIMSSVIPFEFLLKIGDFLFQEEANIVFEDSESTTTLMNFADLVFSNTFFRIFALFSIVAAIVGTLILSRKRSILETLLLYVAFAIPRQRKYWGTIRDSGSKKAIPFATIRIYGHTETDKFLVSEVLADLDGKYRAEFSKSYKKFSLSVKAPGYKELKQRLKYLDSATLSSGLVEEIYMVRENKAETKTRRTKYIQPYINQLLIYALFIISVVFLFLWLLYAVAYPGSFYGWINLAISIYAVPWNIFIISERLRPKVGRVLDLDSKRPIENVLVSVYDNKKQIFAGSTDKRGIVKLDVNSGEYSIRFSHPSYKTSFESADKLDLFKHLTVGLNGYIESNVYLEKTSRNFKQDLTSNLINPFASV